VGQTYGSMVKRICTVGWALTGVIVAALVVQQGAYLDDKEHAFGYACRHLLGHGWVGLLVACVVAANMAACSNLMVNAGAIFTQNIYKSCFKPHASDWELLLTGRFSGLAVTLSGVGFALIIEQVLDAFLFTETLAAFMGIMVVGGIMWRRSNRFGAAAAIFFSFVVYYILNYWDVGQLKLVYKWEAEPFAWAMAAGFAALIIFSLITRPEDHQRIDRFFDSMQRSTDLEGLPEGEPKPLAAERGQDLLLLDAPGWFSARRWHGCFQRYREDLVGFVLAWGVVCLLLLGAWGLMQIGK
jgi:Na+/proline symporter